MTAVVKSKNWKLTLLFWIALISWWAIVYCNWPMILTLWIIALIILVNSKTRLKWFLLVFSSWIFLPAINFTLGTIGYLTGEARIKNVGLPMPEFFNLDDDYRAYKTSTGCVRTGLEPLTIVPNNFAVKLWTYLHGYQRETYTGIYPDEEQSGELISKYGKEVEIVQSETGVEFNLNGEVININRDRIFQEQLTIDAKSAQVAIIDNELLIIKPGDAESSNEIYLADIKSRRVFARYYGRYLFHKRQISQ